MRLFISGMLLLSVQYVNAASNCDINAIVPLSPQVKALLWRRKWQPTPVFLPGESQGWGAWWAAIYGVTQSRTRLK